MREPTPPTDAEYSYFWRIFQPGWLRAAAGIWLALFALAATTFPIVDHPAARWIIGFAFTVSVFLGIKGVKRGATEFGRIAILLCVTFAYLGVRKIRESITSEESPQTSTVIDPLREIREITKTRSERTPGRKAEARGG